MKTEQFGIHYILDGYNADFKILSNKEILLNILSSLPVEMGMHIICDPVLVEVGHNNLKDPGGLSGFVMIAESHLAFHTFPARGFVTIDVYTCQNELDTDLLTEKFVSLFKLGDIDIQVIPRGKRYPANNLSN